jgi:putative oxidoreductase
MFYYNFERMNDGVLLAGRLLLVLLFLISGWIKLSSFDDTITLMVKSGMPAPAVMAVVAILLELPVALAILLGFATRPLALIFAGYAVIAALMGHRYWTMSGPEQLDNLFHFYKNVSIAGGFLLLAAAGPGRYSIDALLARKLSLFDRLSRGTS